MKTLHGSDNYHGFTMVKALALITIITLGNSHLFAANTGEITEDDRPLTLGLLTVTIPPVISPSFVTGAQTGTYGSLQIVHFTGIWIYIIDNLAAVTDQLADGEVVNDILLSTRSVFHQQLRHLQLPSTVQMIHRQFPTDQYLLMKTSVKIGWYLHWAQRT